MFTLFIAVAVLENLEAFYTAVHVFNQYSVFGQVAVKLFLQFR